MSQNWKDKIQIGVLIKRLHDNANGKVEMTNSQVKSAEILLRKVTPDLQSVALKNDEESGPLQITWAGK